MKDPNNPCLFCNSKISGIAHENELAYASYDTYPVSDQHCLIIPKRHVVDYFDLSDEDAEPCQYFVIENTINGNNLLVEFELCYYNNKSVKVLSFIHNNEDEVCKF